MSNNVINPQAGSASTNFYPIMAPNTEAALLSLGYILIESCGKRLEEETVQSMIMAKAGVNAAKDQLKAGIHEAIGTGLRALGEIVSGGLQTTMSAVSMSQMSSFNAEGETELNNANNALKTIKESDTMEVELSDMSAEGTELKKERIQELINNPEEFGKPLSEEDQSYIKTSGNKRQELQSAAQNYRDELSKSVAKQKSDYFEQKLRPAMDAAMGAGRLTQGGLEIGTSAEQAESAEERKSAQIAQITQEMARTLTGQLYTISGQLFQQAEDTIKALIGISEGNVGR
ncbi:MAG: hypothetical protein AB7N99_08675 [Simkaniaceae bacterium]